MYGYLISALLSLFGLNLHGSYKSVRSASDAADIYLGTIKNGGTTSIIAMWLAFLATILLFVVLLY